MYIPKHNRMKNEDEIFDFIKSNNFGILVSLNDSKITVTHIPFLLKRGEGKYGEQISWNRVNKAIVTLQKQILSIKISQGKY